MSLYKSLIRPILFRFDSENVHEFGTKTLEYGLGSATARKLARRRNLVEGFGKISRFGIDFANPVGIAAGFDKNGVVHRQLAALGFGFVEIGTVTLEAQPGNAKPRMFRIPEDEAIINRLGFNNLGAVALSQRLQKVEKECVLGINIGKNKLVPNEESIENYLAVFRKVRDHADYVTVNVSSPNTPGLRDLQKVKPLEALLKEILNEKGKGNDLPILLKIAPDLSEGEIEAIADVCLRNEISGLIATNTTSAREGLSVANKERFGDGGLSGRPITGLANDVLKKVYKQFGKKIPIIGVGGILTPEDAFERVISGASLIQLYTGFVYGGPGTAREINKGLLELLKRDGFKHIDEAVGSAN